MFKRLHAFHCGTETCSEKLFDPAASDASAVRRMPYFFYLIEHNRGLVAFDTGPHADFVRNNISYFGPAAADWRVALNSGDDATDQLAAIGVDIKDVTTVLLSHLHYDHAGGMQQFANATFVVQEREWAFAHDPSPQQVNNYVKAEFDIPSSSLRLIEGRFDVFGDDSLILIPTPGHTPGHQSLLVKGAQTAYLLTGDAAYLSDLDDDACLPGPALAWSQEAMAQSRNLLLQIRDRTHAKVLSTHDPAFIGAVRLAPQATYS